MRFLGYPRRRRLRQGHEEGELSPRAWTPPHVKNKGTLLGRIDGSRLLSLGRMNWRGMGRAVRWWARVGGRAFNDMVSGVVLGPAS